jgi:DNA-binding winged helix-turn-helix (wHTH) protein/TolB-like protein
MHEARVLRFGAFELDQAAGELRKQGRLVALTGQPLRVLDLLASNAGRIVTRAELQRQIWGDDTHVDFDASLSTCINQVRTALGDRAAAPRFVETLPKRGYRFVAPVDFVAGTPATNLTASQHLHLRPRRRAWTIVGGACVAVAAAAIVINRPASSPASGSPPPELVAARPIPVVVVPVWLDRRLSALEPLASSLTDAIIGALANEGGQLLRVASPMAVRHLREGATSIYDIRDLGADYFVTVKLGSLGNRINVHAKVSTITGWMLWSTDRTFRPADLPREQLSLAADLSKHVLREIQAGQNPRTAPDSASRVDPGPQPVERTAFTK